MSEVKKESKAKKLPKAKVEAPKMVEAPKPVVEVKPVVVPKPVLSNKVVDKDASTKSKRVRVIKKKTNVKLPEKITIVDHSVLTKASSDNLWNTWWYPGLVVLLGTLIVCLGWWAVFLV